MFGVPHLIFLFLKIRNQINRLTKAAGITQKTLDRGGGELMSDVNFRILQCRMSMSSC